MVCKKNNNLVALSHDFVLCIIQKSFITQNWMSTEQGHAYLSVSSMKMARVKGEHVRSRLFSFSTRCMTWRLFTDDTERIPGERADVGYLLCWLWLCVLSVSVFNLTSFVHKTSVNWFYSTWSLKVQNSLDRFWILAVFCF